MHTGDIGVASEYRADPDLTFYDCVEDLHSLDTSKSLRWCLVSIAYDIASCCPLSKPSWLTRVLLAGFPRSMMWSRRAPAGHVDTTSSLNTRSQVYSSGSLCSRSLSQGGGMHLANDSRSLVMRRLSILQALHLWACLRLKQAEPLSQLSSEDIDAPDPLRFSCLPAHLRVCLSDEVATTE